MQPSIQSQANGQWFPSQHCCAAPRSDRLLPSCNAPSLQAFNDPATGRLCALECDMQLDSPSWRIVVKGSGPLGTFSAHINGLTVKGTWPGYDPIGVRQAGPISTLLHLCCRVTINGVGINTHAVRVLPTPRQHHPVYLLLCAGLLLYVYVCVGGGV